MPKIASRPGAFTQYVILGAGLGSFIWRRPEGSEVAFSYLAEDAVLDDVGHPFVDAFRTMAAASGEPLAEGWSRIHIEEMVARCGLKISDHPTRAELTQRYFADRVDGLMPFAAETLLTATVG